MIDVKMAIRAKVSRGVEQFISTITTVSHRLASVGYSWEFCGALDRKGRVFADRYLRPSSDSWRPLDLSEHPGLFLSLAETDPTEDGILKFANRYGLLGFGLYRCTFRDIGGQVEVESLLSWKQQIADISYAVRLWTDLREGVTAEVARRLAWADAGRSALAYNPASETSFQPVILERPPDVQEIEDMEEKRILDLAWIALRQMLNEKLKELPITRQFAVDGSGMVDSVGTALASVWHSAAAAIASDARFNKCPHCEKWFRVSVDKQDDIRFCSVSCRNKAYRWRIATARKLSEEGVSIPEIAARLDVEEDSILRWVKEQ